MTIASMQPVRMNPPARNSVRFGGLPHQDHKADLEPLVAMIQDKVSRGMITYHGLVKVPVYGGVGQITVNGEGSQTDQDYFVFERTIGRVPKTTIYLLSFAKEGGANPVKEIVLKENPGQKGEYTLTYEQKSGPRKKDVFKTTDAKVTQDFLAVYAQMKPSLYTSSEPIVKPTF